MFEVILTVLVSIYFLLGIILTTGLNKKYPRLVEEELPSVSVIVAARNEEQNIVRCMESLDKLEYPDGKLEIIIIDDNSSDSTYSVVEKFIAGKPRFRLVKTEKQIGNTTGKANAIANALECASGAVIMTTDADCTVGPLWAKTLASYYTKDVAMVNGFTRQVNGSFFHSMQDTDFMYLIAVAAGAMNNGFGISCIGNNMSYRKDVYEETGGYGAFPPSVTEDFQLLKAIKSLGKYKLLYPVEKTALVNSLACDDLRSLFRQKKRWGVGGLDSSKAGFGIMGVAFLLHVMILLLPFFYTSGAAILISFKFITDYFFLLPVYNRLGRRFKFADFIVFEVYFIIYSVLLPFIVLSSRKVKWKGREYN